MFKQTDGSHFDSLAPAFSLGAPTCADIPFYLCLCFLYLFLSRPQPFSSQTTLGRTFLDSRVGAAILV